MSENEEEKEKERQNENKAERQVKYISIFAVYISIQKQKKTQPRKVVFEMSTRMNGREKKKQQKTKSRMIKRSEM